MKASGCTITASAVLLLLLLLLLVVTCVGVVLLALRRSVVLRPIVRADNAHQTHDVLARAVVGRHPDLPEAPSRAGTPRFLQETLLFAFMKRGENGIQKLRNPELAFAQVWMPTCWAGRSHIIVTGTGVVCGDVPISAAVRSCEHGACGRMQDEGKPGLATWARAHTKAERVHRGACVWRPVLQVVVAPHKAKPDALRGVANLGARQSSASLLRVAGIHPLFRERQKIGLAKVARRERLQVVLVECDFSELSCFE